LQTGQFRIYF